MELLKLTYTPVDTDEFQYCTVIGDIDSIFNLYCKLESLKIKNLRVFDIVDMAEVDMTKGKLHVQCRCGRLNTLCTY